MTTEERFARIEHVTAALAEERRKDREEYRQLWRDTQRQIAETNATVSALAFKIADTQDAIRAESDRAAGAEHELRSQITALGHRVDGLVSGIGELVRILRPPQ